MTNETRTTGRIEPMTCPTCRRAMNPHAEKPVIPVDAAEASRVDWMLGGLIEEVHQCPHCGGLRSRRVAS